METNIQIVFYSTYGHIYRMAEAMAEGARYVVGAKVDIFQMAELIPEATLAAMRREGGAGGFRPYPHRPTPNGSPRRTR